MESKMNTNPRIQIIVGSVREGRASAPIAHWAQKEAKARGDIDIDVIDLKEWSLPTFALKRPPAMGNYQDQKQIEFARRIGEADGYIFVSPEYNHGYSSVLKNAIDYVYAEWHRKPVGFVSFGNVGGARSVEQLRLVCVELEMAPLKHAVHLFGVHARIQDDAFAPEDRDTKALNTCLDELEWWARALRSARLGLEA